MSIDQHFQLPEQLPFHCGATIGRGSYATVKLCRYDQRPDVYAVKFINKPVAISPQGGLTLKQIGAEVQLHKLCTGHPNIVDFIDSDEDNIWRWVVMEWARGGDLFDKIEPDVGVEPDIAHFYFQQMIAGVRFLHERGVAHRDIKPENVFLDGDGNLLIGDFGLAAMFRHKGITKYVKGKVGSLPYLAPEVVMAEKYDAAKVDVWSCGVVLFVLLLGTCPWDEPAPFNPEFSHYARGGLYEPWDKLDLDALGLVRGMLMVDPERRMTIDDVERHPWFTRRNPMRADNGQCTDPLLLATRLLEKLQVDLEEAAARAKSDRSMSDVTIRSGDAYDWRETGFSATQPDYRRTTEFDDIRMGNGFVSASQPQARTVLVDDEILNSLADDPSMSQFSPTQGISETLTQKARRFNDICPAERLTRFYVAVDLPTFLPILSNALQRMGVPNTNIPSLQPAGLTAATVRIQHVDQRKLQMHGEIQVQRYAKGRKGDVYTVHFHKKVGDPLEWRRFFKGIARECREVIVTA
ncbi:hypothetical protein G7K_1034-t1 [Saitoella complicata NRRL Y-17804]|uniref:non-specific serine/threonine protein kinase n=1 Tax=Saitoella complicata (strain BCRC 22490 / CBS 7301 / JCM 7358 / NBRC 10748 / NRRL Y-17804) TaxID=698492 RepID=A0A0E9NAS0_SAICN|nr:hypothetical protein G7K_1034-t1 [Saitoella complicata NRRL Y-17804]